MTISYTLLLLVGIFLPACSQALTPKTGGIGPLFTLSITANPSDPEHDDTQDMTFKAGTPIILRIRKTNTTDHGIPKIGPENGAFGHKFDVRDSKGNPVPEQKPDPSWALGGGGAILLGSEDSLLKPGEKEVHSARLTKWYDFSIPGTYTIQVSEHVSDDPNSAVIKSNKITITVLPPDAPPVRH